MSEKFDNFKKALEELCVAHDVTLTVSEYDNLVVTDYDKSLGAIYVSGIVDDTKDNESAEQSVADVFADLFNLVTHDVIVNNKKD